MRLKNFLIYGIDMDDTTDKLIYYAKDLDSPTLNEFEIKEIGRKYPSDFLYGILLDNGYKPFTKSETYQYDKDFINSHCPLLFTAIYDGGVTRNGKMKDAISVHTLIVIPNMEVRQSTEMIFQLKRLNDGNGF